MLPLCKPGAITKTLKSMFNNNSAFYLRPRVDFRLWSWLLRSMPSTANQKDMLATGTRCTLCCSPSDQEYRRLFESELTNTEFDTTGMLFVFATQNMFDDYAATNELMIREYGVRADRWYGKQLVELEPPSSSDWLGPSSTPSTATCVPAS